MVHSFPQIIQTFSRENTSIKFKSSKRPKINMLTSTKPFTNISIIISTSQSLTMVIPMVVGLDLMPSTKANRSAPRKNSIPSVSKWTEDNFSSTPSMKFYKMR